MKIALLAHLHHPIAEPYLGGTEMHTAVVADELVRRGHEVTLFAQEGSRTSARLVPLVPSDFTFGSMAGPNGDRSEEILVAAVTAAIAQIHDGEYDVVINNSLGPLPYTLLRNHPMITVLHTPPTLEKVLAVITAPGWTPDPRHRYVSVSEHNSAAWRTVLPEVVCVPNGVRLADWSDSGAAEDGLAVWSARITPEKGLHLAIDAVRRAGLRLEFSGPVADRAYVKAEVAPRLGADVTWAGHLGHGALAQHLARGAVFVSSSVWAEPFGLSLVESMACGTPVAAFPTGAAPEIVTRGAGALADGVTTAALADAVEMARWCDRADVRRRAEDFDVQVMIDRYEKLLVDALG